MMNRSRFLKNIIVVAVSFGLCRDVIANPTRSLPKDVGPDFNRTQLLKDIDFITDERFTRNGIGIAKYLRRYLMTTWRVPNNDIMSIHYYDYPYQKLVSGGPNVDEKLCRSQLDYLNSIAVTTEDLMNSKDVKFFTFLDSYGRPEAGTVSGSLFWLGNYQQCISTTLDYSIKDIGKDVSELNQLQTTRYCVASIRWNQWLRTRGFDDDRYASIKVGICLPEACDSTIAEKYNTTIQSLMSTNFAQSYREFYVASVYCLPDKNSELTQWTIDPSTNYFVRFLVAWAILIGLSTLIDMISIEHRQSPSKSSNGDPKQAQRMPPHNKEAKDLPKVRDRVPVGAQVPTGVGKDMKCAHRCTLSQYLEYKLHQSYSYLSGTFEVLMSFSLVRNISSLFDVHTSSGRKKYTTKSSQQVSLKFLDGFKAINAFIITVAHNVLLNTAVIHFTDLGAKISSYYYAFLWFAAFSVNNFIFITGVLITYKIARLSISKPIGARFWISFAFDRYLRIIPLWAILFWFMKSSRFLGSGPLWEYATSSTSRMHNCLQESWTTVLFALANFKMPYESCISSGWYLSIDVQYAIACAPIATMIINRSKRLASTIFTLFTLVCSGIALYLSYNGEYSQVDMINKTTIGAVSISLREMGPIYILSIFRVGHYLFGILTGHLLEGYTGNKDFETSLIGGLHKWWLFKPMRAITTVWLFAFGLVLGISVNFLLFDELTKYFFIVGLVSVAQHIILCIFIILIATGKYSWIGSFLSHPIFRPFSTMCLSTLLVNPIVVVLLYQYFTQSLQFTTQMEIIISSATFVITYFFSAFVYVIFEGPLSSIIKVISD